MVALLRIATATVLLAGLTAQPAASVCIGDCAGNNSVTVDSIVKLVGIALGNLDRAACAQGVPAEREVDVTVIVAAVRHALDGCPPVPTVMVEASHTPTPSSTSTPSAPPSATASETPTPTPSESATPAAPATATATHTPAMRFCDLPGAVRFAAPGRSVVAGGPPETSKLDFLQLPIGFCAHYFATVGNVRQLRFAPGGELFVASPTTFTTGGGRGGKSAILVLPDDDRDGVADSQLTFRGNLPSTQGMLFSGSFLYYQDDTRILRTDYVAGQRVAQGMPVQVANITHYYSRLHWPKMLDQADDGTIYVSNGGDDGQPCRPNDRAFTGGILRLDGQGGTVQIAKGFRNPIAVRCVRGYNQCFAIELAKDFSHMVGGREKLVPIREGDDWGFPCCATKDKAYNPNASIDCSEVAQDTNSFLIGGTPFDLDYELGKWPAPWGYRAYVPLHGAYGNWDGARVVSIELDEMTGTTLPGSDLPGVPSGSFVDFATGWDDDTRSHGRPANVAFAPDGRLFLSNDVDGLIVWMAPFELSQP